MSTETTALKFVKLEHNIFLDGEKVAAIHEDGTLRMAKGQSAIKPDLMIWLASRGQLPTPAANNDAEPDDYEPNTEAEPEEAPAPKLKKGEIPPCPPMTIEAGDKTPEVIAWYKKYKPAEFAEKYKGRKFSIDA
jgi:hypothetical protein